ncbi:MAG: hypothetical protein MUF04_04355 [Akkermansiaceae bacterium]|nr:hypothetical protein [Akkermansiaceae bacterium]
MRVSCAALLAVVLLPCAGVADPLSSADRELLLESLDKIDKTVSERVDARYRAALAAYREALLSEEAALKFYLQCVEKVDFTDNGRRPADFRAWKKRQDENLDQATMRRALLHQLRWLVLTLKASSENADMEQLTTEGLAAIESIFADKPLLTSQRGVLGQSVIGTVFARAYGIEGVRSGKWPTSPLDYASFFEGLVFPRYRAAGDFKNLRAAWTRRIQMSMEVIEPAPNDNPLRNAILGEPTRRQERFRGTDLPSLQWQMETDLFKCGDQRQAATNMVAHLNKYITHQEIDNWTAELRALLQGGAPTAPDPSPAPAESAATDP